MKQPKETDICSLIKFGERIFMEQLLATGQLYMQAMSVFRGLENDGAVRSDPREGLRHLLQSSHGYTVNFAGIEMSAASGLLNAGLTMHQDLGQHVYCTYAVQYRHLLGSLKGRPAVGERALREFGPSAVVIHNPAEFLRRVKRAAASGVGLIGMGLVEYIDPDLYSGPMLHKKTNDYSWQSEHRIAVNATGEKSYMLELGPLLDIAFLTESSAINASLKVEVR